MKLPNTDATHNTVCVLNSVCFTFTENQYNAGIKEWSKQICPLNLKSRNEEDAVWADKLFMNALRACYNYYQTTDHFKLKRDYWSRTSFVISLQKITIWIVLDKVDLWTKYPCIWERKSICSFEVCFFTV